MRTISPKHGGLSRNSVMIFACCEHLAKLKHFQNVIVFTHFKDL